MLIFLLFFLRISLGNVVEGDFIVVSCNCTMCCYPTGSRVKARLDYEFSEGTFIMDLYGKAAAVDKTASVNCTQFIQSDERCIQTQLNNNGSLVERVLDCSNTSITNATLIGNTDDISNVQLQLSQNGIQCLIAFTHSLLLTAGWTSILLLFAGLYP